MAEEVKTSKATSEVEKKPMVSDLDSIRSKIRTGEDVCAMSFCHFGRGKALTYVHGPLGFQTKSVSTRRIQPLPYLELSARDRRASSVFSPLETSKEGLSTAGSLALSLF